MKTKVSIITASVVLMACAGLYAGETSLTGKKKSIEPIKMSGFRIGVSVLAGSKASEFRNIMEDSGAIPVISQFGWQYEFRFPAGESGVAAVVEMIALLGGLNQGLIIPTLNLPIGIRSASGFEIGAGPHFGMGRLGDDIALSSGFVVAGGITRKMGKLNIPVNFAFMQGRTSGEDKAGYSLTLLTGFAF